MNEPHQEVILRGESKGRLYGDDIAQTFEDIAFVTTIEQLLDLGRRGWLGWGDERRDADPARAAGGLSSFQRQISS